MKKIKYLSLILVLLMTGNVFSQSLEPVKKKSLKKQNKINVTAAIKKLKEGGAVVYIVKDRKMKTDMLKERGMEAKALELEKERLRREKIIVKGLLENFTFCPIYFVFQSDLKKLEEGTIANNLLDTTLTKDSNIKFAPSYFLVIEYGDIYDEQEKVYCDTCKWDNTGAMTLKQNAFVFKNIYLSQLTKPFPYYMTCHYPNKEIALKVKKMSNRLQAFYTKASQ